MDITIKINTDNAAFEDNPSELPEILGRLKRKMENIGGLPQVGEEFYLRDSNGNTVGAFEVKESES